MKKLIFTATLLFFISSTKAAVLDSIIILKGYYVIRYIKKEIAFTYEQEVRRLRGDSFTSMTDLDFEAFFIPSELENKSLMRFEYLGDRIKSQNSFHKDTIFYMPTDKHTEEYILKLSKKQLDLSKEICLFNELYSKAPYFSIVGSDEYLYKCIYIYGKARAFNIENTNSVRFKIDLDIDAVNERSAKIWVLFLTSVTDYNPYVIHKDLTPWYPYIKDTGIKK